METKNNYSDEKWIGQRFGALTVLEPVKHIGSRGNTAWYWKVHCDCGKEKIAVPFSTINSKNPSCGCQHWKNESKYMSENWIGKKFGKLTVDSAIVTRDSSGRSIVRWNVTCDCGNKILANPSKLVYGVQNACVCGKRESSLTSNKKHGESHTRLFAIWVSMRDRCNNPQNNRYNRYGGRGITVCDEWSNSYESFRNWAVENGYDKNAKYGECTIDRINVDGNYEPSNCRWVDMKTQSRNKSDNRVIEIDGVVKTLAEWCEYYGMSYKTVHRRIISLGWDAKTALEIPNMGKGANQTTYNRSNE